MSTSKIRMVPRVLKTLYLYHNEALEKKTRIITTVLEI